MQITRKFNQAFCEFLKQQTKYLGVTFLACSNKIKSIIWTNVKINKSAHREPVCGLRRWLSNAISLVCTNTMFIVCWKSERCRQIAFVEPTWSSQMTKPWRFETLMPRGENIKGLLGSHELKAISRNYFPFHQFLSIPGNQTHPKW